MSFLNILKLIDDDDDDVLQSAGLLMVHFHSRFLTDKKAMNIMGNDVASPQYREPDVSLWYFYIQRYQCLNVIY